jgi:hypothetical protein
MTGGAMTGRAMTAMLCFTSLNRDKSENLLWAIKKPLCRERFFFSVA